MVGFSGTHFSRFARSFCNYTDGNRAPIMKTLRNVYEKLVYRLYECLSASAINTVSLGVYICFYHH